MHLGVAFVFSFTGCYPVFADFGEAIEGVDVAWAGCVVEVEVLHVGVFEVDAAEGDFEFVAGRFMDDGFVLLGGLGEGFAVGYRLDEGEFGVEGVDGWFGACSGFFYVHFSGDSAFYVESGSGGGVGCFDRVGDDLER